MRNTPVFGLVLDGGESRRMGIDKGSLIYHKLSPLEQRLRHIRSFEQLGIPAFVSGSITKQPTPPVPFIPDREDLKGMGPGAGILSAHLYKPEAAWLVVACDFPFADKTAIELLLHKRRAGTSTAFLHPDGTVEPLFAIWEPATLAHFLLQFRNGNKSPRRALEETNALTSIPENPRTLININSPVEAQAYPELQH